MNALRRRVEGWMGADLYRRLGDEPDIETTWKLLRDIVGEQLFSGEFVSVPFLESAMYYNQLFVFIKKKSILSKLGLQPPIYKLTGNLDYLVNRELSTWEPQFDFSPWDVADGLDMYREYSLSVASTPDRALAKRLEFRASNVHVRSATPPGGLRNSLTIRRELLHDLQTVKSVYVITDVALANVFTLGVHIGERRKTLLYDHPVPVGFKYRKYRVMSDGRFAAELRTTMKVGSHDAEWLRPLAQPIPMPRRKQTGDARPRKLKSNLTIPTPERPRVIRRRGIGPVIREEIIRVQ